MKRIVGDFFHLSMEPLAVMDFSGVLVQVNPAWATIGGLNPESLVGTDLLENIDIDDRDAVIDGMRRLEAGDSVKAVRIRFLLDAGEFRWLEWMATPIAESAYVLAVFRDVTAVCRTEENLRVARDEAQLASRAKSEFLSRMSHELRTPLNSIIGFSQLLEMDELTPTQAENVSFILKSGLHLLDLINEVLEVARIESGNLRLSVERVPVAERIRFALNLVRPLATERGIKLLFDHPPEDLLVMADNQRLLQILLNLLSNAIKYSSPGDEVFVDTEVSGGTVTIAVVDTGPGISEADQARLFDPFERLGAEATDIEGTGIGLPLARSLSREMGGALTVSSQPGSGSAFCLELRAADARNEEVEVVEEGGEARHVGSDDTSADDASSAVEMTVLCIEGNLVNTELIEAAVKKLPDVRLLAVTQGQLGLDLAVSTRPDLIFLDLQLPDMDGGQVLRAIRSEPTLNECRVVVCSADVTRGLMEDLELQGADGHMFKPIDIHELLRTIEQARPGSRKGAGDGPESSIR